MIKQYHPRMLVVLGFDLDYFRVHPSYQISTLGMCKHAPQNYFEYAICVGRHVPLNGSEYARDAEHLA